jgi:hypothetical protein
MVAALIEASKSYGREFTLVIVLMSAFGIASKVVWESNTVRLNQQDVRIDKSEEFIRTELLELNQQSMETTREATSVMKSVVDALDRSTNAIEKRTE